MKFLRRSRIVILLILAVLTFVFLFLGPSMEDPESTTLPLTTPPPTYTIGSPITVGCDGHDSDPYVNVNKADFYANYTPACCYVDAQYRTKHFLMSGSLEVPDQYATISSYQPTEDGMLLRNMDRFYEDDGNTYVACSGGVACVANC